MGSTRDANNREEGEWMLDVRNARLMGEDCLERQGINFDVMPNGKVLSKRETLHFEFGGSTTKVRLPLFYVEHR